MEQLCVQCCLTVIQTARLGAFVSVGVCTHAIGVMFCYHFGSLTAGTGRA